MAFGRERTFPGLLADAGARNLHIMLRPIEDLLTSIANYWLLAQHRLGRFDPSFRILYWSRLHWEFLATWGARHA